MATLKVPDADGKTREIRYVKRRFIPPSEGTTVIVEHTVAQGERIDNITALYLGDPTQFWRLCDGNEALTPLELEETGRSIKILMPTE
jgi:hypothetical protein